MQASRSTGCRSEKVDNKIRCIRESTTVCLPGDSVTGGGSMFGSKRGFADKTGDIEGTREDIAQDAGFGAVVEPEPGRAFDVVTGLVGVAAFCVAETAHAQGPGRGIDFQIASQAQRIITWEGIVDEETEAQGMVGVSVRARESG